MIGLDEAAYFGVRPPAWNTSWEMLNAFTLTLLLVVREERLLLGADALDPSFGDALDG
jgi:hypothetical protein